jgi:hypothetical protein
MGEVVEFPGPAERDWRGIEAEAAAFLKSAGLSDDAIAWIQGELKRRVCENSRCQNFTISAPTEAHDFEIARAVVERMQEKYSPLVAALVCQMTLALTELYLAKYQADAPPPGAPVASKSGLDAIGANQ